MRHEATGLVSLVGLLQITSIYYFLLLSFLMRKRSNKPTKPTKPSVNERERRGEETATTVKTTPAIHRRSTGNGASELSAPKADMR